ncbi:hypothetical protein CGRA01v4_04678 [Colletotrichum graminicola]|nr:hypothetical protein CGRA01v4_04678 [Colletotrichum graminicola]
MLVLAPSPLFLHSHMSTTQTYLSSNGDRLFLGPLGALNSPKMAWKGTANTVRGRILTLPRGCVLYVDVDAMWAFWATRPRPCASIWGEILDQAFFFFYKKKNFI